MKMSAADIARKLNLVRSTVHEHRTPLFCVVPLLFKELALSLIQEFVSPEH